MLVIGLIYKLPVCSHPVYETNIHDRQRCTLPSRYRDRTDTISTFHTLHAPYSDPIIISMNANAYILDFLRDLAANNNREWFTANKSRYDTAYAMFNNEVATFIAELSRFDAELQYLMPQQCIYRIYRDLRFTPDKRPYKQHFGAYIAMHGGRKSRFCGYYLHLEPENSALGTGIYVVEPKLLRAIRDELVHNYDTLRQVTEAKSFKRYFNGIEPMRQEQRLRHVPKGYPADTLAAEWLKLKTFMIGHDLTNEVVCADDFMAKAVEICRAMKPFNDFFNAIIEDYV